MSVYSINTMCRILGVSRSQYYSWKQSPKTLGDYANQALEAVIKILFERARGVYGTRRLKSQLFKLGLIVSRRKIGRLLHKMGLACKSKKRFRVTTDSNHHLPVSPNLLDRQFTVSRSDKYYVGDITYIATKQGWLYLAVVIDLYSRRVVGWSMANHMRASLVNDALLMAIWTRKPEKGLVWHSDRGSQYASSSHRELLAEHGIIQSMSRKGNCWDNAVSESFFHSLKTELVHHCHFDSQEEAKKAIFDYIEIFYNRQRLHSANDYLSPDDYEKQKKHA